MKRLLSSTAFITIPVFASIFSSKAIAYQPAAEISSKVSGARNIGEINYMQPLIKEWDNNLPLLDLKIKADNKRSKEVNLGLVFRHNYDDKLIFGVYGYYDYRVTGSGFTVGGFTVGSEILSDYVDVRGNLYIPEKKKKKITTNKNKTIEIKGTSIYTLSGGHMYEQGLRGYDVEIGVPVFGFSENLSEVGTKIFAAHYNFTGKKMKAIRGNRFRIEQPLCRDIWLGNNKLRINLNAETQFDKTRGRQTFIGMGTKVVFDAQKNRTNRRSSLRNRMMDTIVRDVDIVTQVQQGDFVKSPLVTADGRQINKIIYVGAADGDYIGDGTADSPLSIEQLNKTDLSDVIVIVSGISSEKGGRSITQAEYSALVTKPEVVNEKNKISLTSKGSSGGEAVLNIKCSKEDGGVFFEVNDSQNTVVTTNSPQLSKVFKEINSRGVSSSVINRSRQDEIRRTSRIIQGIEVAPAHDALAPVEQNAQPAPQPVAPVAPPAPPAPQPVAPIAPPAPPAPQPPVAPPAPQAAVAPLAPAVGYDAAGLAIPMAPPAPQAPVAPPASQAPVEENFFSFTSLRNQITNFSLGGGSGLKRIDLS